MIAALVIILGGLLAVGFFMRARRDARPPTRRHGDAPRDPHRW